MAVVSGVRYSWTDQANVAIDMSDTLSMLAPSDVPLLQRIGLNSLSRPCTAVKHEWLEDELRPLDSTNATSGSLNNTTDPLTFAVTTGQGAYFRADDIILVESELMKVTSVAGDNITVSRGYGGSTVVAHAGTQTIRIIGNAVAQDAGQGASRTTTKTGFFNYTQIYEDTVVVTSTAQAIDKYVEKNELDAQLARALKVAWIQWERSLIYGRKVAPAPGVPSAMDGILVRIATNVYAKGDAYFNEEDLLTAMEAIWKAGGTPTAVYLNSFQKRQANKFLDSQRMTTRTDRVAGAVVDTYTSDFGTVDIVLDRNMPADTVLILDESRIGFGPLTDHVLSAAPVETNTRLKQAMQIIGQYTSETRNEKAHAKITGLATS